MWEGLQIEIPLTGYTFTPCVGFFISHEIDTRWRHLQVLVCHSKVTGKVGWSDSLVLLIQSRTLSSLLLHSRLDVLLFLVIVLQIHPPVSAAHKQLDPHRLHHLSQLCLPTRSRWPIRRQRHLCFSLPGLSIHETVETSASNNSHNVS